jgi:hypothetical protein
VGVDDAQRLVRVATTSLKGRRGMDKKLTPSLEARTRVKMTHAMPAAISSRTMASMTAPAVFMVVVDAVAWSVSEASARLGWDARVRRRHWV